MYACIYIGEKLPWISLHQLVQMIFIAAYALFFAVKYTKPRMVLACAFLVVVTFLPSGLYSRKYCRTNCEGAELGRPYGDDGRN